jgi:hypothetical protein
MEVIFFPVYSGGNFKGWVGADIFKLCLVGLSNSNDQLPDNGGFDNGIRGNRMILETASADREAL